MPCEAPPISFYKAWSEARHGDILAPVPLGIEEHLYHFPPEKKIDRAAFRGHSFCHYHNSRQEAAAALALPVPFASYYFALFRDICKRCWWLGATAIVAGRQVAAARHIAHLRLYPSAVIAIAILPAIALGWRFLVSCMLSPAFRLQAGRRLQPPAPGKHHAGRPGRFKLKFEWEFEFEFKSGFVPRSRLGKRFRRPGCRRRETGVCTVRCAQPRRCPCPAHGALQVRRACFSSFRELRRSPRMRKVVAQNQSGSS